MNIFRMASLILSVILTLITIGGIVYYLLAFVCARGQWNKRKKISGEASFQLPPIALLKPLCGAEPELESCLESFFTQDYPEFEILFAVRTQADPAVKVVDHLRHRYPQIPAQLIYTGEPPYANAKVYSLEKMAEVAAHEILVITDSDTSVTSDYLKAIAKEFSDPEVGAMTNLYRGVGSGDLWSKLEALGMSTEFMAGVVVAERLEGMKFTLGPSMAIRAETLKAIGGFAAMHDYLADDFVLGNWADAAGWRVTLSSYIVNHHASTQGFAKTFKHRLRWNRSTRFSRPAGYFGQGFTYGSSWAILSFLIAPGVLSGTLLGLCLLVRWALAWQLGSRLLEDSQVVKRFWMVPVQDVLSFISWLGGFTGKEIVWRGERYRLLRDGRFALVSNRIGE